MAATLQIFIAYSRKDTSFLDELRMHFTPLERSGKVKIWYDGKIEPGVVWETAIKDNLHSADVILLLVSADAIASDYFYEQEMSNALTRHNSGDARVVPLILRPCAWQETPLGELQALPQDGLAVTEWPNRDAAYTNAVNSLTFTINNIISQRAAVAEREEKERQQLEANLRRLSQDQHASTQLAERQKKEPQQVAEKQRQLEEKRKRNSENAERHRQQEEAARLKLAEEARLKVATAAQLRGERIAFLSSPKVWGSGLIGMLALVLTNWVCNTESSSYTPENEIWQDDSTLLNDQPATTDTPSTGVETFSLNQLPKDVSVGKSKKHLSLDSLRITDSNQKKANNKYLVIAGSFLIKGAADREANNLLKIGYSNTLVESLDKGGYYFIIVDRFESLSDAETLVKSAEKDGIKSYIKIKS